VPVGRAQLFAGLLTVYVLPAGDGGGNGGRRLGPVKFPVWHWRHRPGFVALAIMLALTVVAGRPAGGVLVPPGDFTNAAAAIIALSQVLIGGRSNT
jgi:hypothetical protein